MKKIAFFDFDGTITKQDSYLSFLIFSSPSYFLVFSFIVLLPVIILYLLKVIDNSLAKAITLRWFYKGIAQKRLEGLSLSFNKLVLPKIIRPKALEKINWHKTNGHELVLVTASVKDWVLPWAKEHGFDKVIATELEVTHGILSGKMKTPNNWGPEKVRRIEQVINLEEYSYSYAYGDSRGDQEMLALADESYYKPFI